MNLKQKLDYHYKAFDKSQISPDPLQFLHLFNREKDIEAIGFISSLFAYGNVKQIVNTLNRILAITNYQPFEFIINFKKKDYTYKLKGLKHRFYNEDDIILLFYMLNEVYDKFDSLKHLFIMNYKINSDIKKSISLLSDYFISLAKKMRSRNISLGLKFMFPSPEFGSACKRMNLFLRWMVRKDELDFGLWNEIPTNKLIIPVDTHVAKVCKSLSLTKRKNADWKMAEEITNNLKRFDKDDPVKYDFAICHIGMRKIKF
jgi:uncharacterized protein (TIGR02757 family)